MTDEPTRPTDDEDRRDEQLAAVLEVPPLDDVTRRRLVRRALDESGEAHRPGRRARTLAVAAAVLAVLVIGGGTALVLRDDGDDTTVASRTEDARGAAEADAAAPAAAAVGDLGDVSDPAVLRESLNEFVFAPAPESGEDEATPGAGAVPEVPPACLDLPAQAGASAPFLVGSGTYEGKAAVILVASRGAPARVVEPANGDQQRIAFVLDATTCQTLAEVPL